MNWPVENKENQEYIHVNDNKTPHSFKITYSYEDADNFIDGAGILITKPFLILDFDNKTYFEAVVKMLEDRGIDAPIMKTDRGGHIWFRTNKQFANKKHFLPLLIDCDIKSWGLTSSGNERKQFSLCKRNGKWRTWLKTVPTWDDVPEIPYWLTPLPKAWSKSNLNIDFDEGERNTNLFRLKIPLSTSFSFTDEQKKVVLETINTYLLPVALPQKEIDAMFSGHSEYDKVLTEEYTKEFFVDNKFQHHNLAKYLKSNNHIRKYKGKLWVFDNGKYQRGDGVIRKICRKMIPILKTNQINEVINYLLDVCEEEYDKNNLIPYIGLSNTIFDANNFTFIPHNPDIFTPVTLDIKYNPNVIEEDEEGFLNWFEEKVLLDIFGTEEWLATFFEIVGYCLVPHTKGQKIFLFVGEGSNGKSIILERILRPMFTGYDSSLSIHDLNDKFKVSMLENSLVNIDSDNSDVTLRDTSIFKKLATGDDITIEEKYSQPFTILNTTKTILAFNKLPFSRDNSKGFIRRLLLVPFKKIYSTAKGNLDTKLPDKIGEHRDLINQYLLFYGIEYLKNLKANNWKFTNEESDILEEYKTTLDVVLQWVTDDELTYKDFVGKPISEMFRLFKSYMDDEGIKSGLGIKMFSKRVISLFEGRIMRKNKRVMGVVSKCFELNEGDNY